MDMRVKRINCVVSVDAHSRLIDIQKGNKIGSIDDAMNMILLSLPNDFKIKGDAI